MAYHYLIKALFAVITVVSIFEAADAHGYLSSPRARNFIAYEDMKWWDANENDPEPESDPYSLNRGGTAAQCGMRNGVGGKNYDLPKNALGGLMKANVQECYEEGSVIDINVVLTAYHGGHFEFYACPISHGEIPTESCFKDHPLEFVEDLLNNAQKDPNYPVRAYIHGLSAMTLGEFRYKYKLPDNLTGELVLIQWYYITGNSCTDEGYADYHAIHPFPSGWNEESSTTCSLPITGDGSEAPERFWNCAEVRITEDCSITTTSTTTPATICTPISQEELGWAATAVSQNDCNKCAQGNHESQYWPCDSNPPLCNCGLETTTTTTTVTTTTIPETTTTTQAAPTTPSPTRSPTALPTENLTNQPTNHPTTLAPSQNPSKSPISNPSQSPTDQPTSSPTTPSIRHPPLTPNPTGATTNQPTNPPTTSPVTSSPTSAPVTTSPTSTPTSEPTNRPTSLRPTLRPTNKPTSGSAAGWYVAGDKCALGTSTITSYTSATECCNKHLGWMGIEMCVSRSTGVHTNKFYADQTANVCRQDCPSENDLPCSGSPADTSLTFFSSLESCCAAKISWEPSCVDKSKGQEPQGSGKYYMNWTYNKCSLDCPQGSAAGCAGVASPWDTLYSTQDACCSAISWVPRANCVYA